MQRFHVKRGDQVVVIAGTEKGKRGKVIRILAAKQRLIVEGVKFIKRHYAQEPATPRGEIVQREGSLHISNVMRADVFDARAAKRTGNAAA